MFRRFLVVGSGALALLVLLAAPEQLLAQHSGGGSGHGHHMGSGAGSRNGASLRPEFHRRMDGRPFDARRAMGRFERLEDRFEDRLENAFRFGRFDPRFQGRFFDPRIDPRFNRTFFVPPFRPGF